MRLRRLWLGLLALVVVSGVASAQTTETKKKKPKKPKVEQPADDTDADAGTTTDQADAGSEFPESKPPPPKLDTTLKETDSSGPNGNNPWAISGRYAGPSGNTPSGSGSNPWGSKKRPDEAPFTPLSVAIFGGYASDDFRIGLGVRAGYTFHFGLYLGGAFTYHFGTTDAIGISESAYYGMFEVGWDFRVVPEAVIRPYIGTGYVVFHGSSADGSSSASSGTIGFTPGVQLDYQISSTPLFVGVDIRLLNTFLSLLNGTPVGVYGTVGGRF